MWYDGLGQLVFKMSGRSRYTNFKNFVVVSCRPYMESITKLLDKNLSQLRYPWGEEILTLIQAGILGPLFPFFLMNNSWLFLLLCLIHGLLYLSSLQVWTFANRTIARWRHLTTTTRILDFVVFLCKLRLLFLNPQRDWQI